jgi:hypothetical protein
MRLSIVIGLLLSVGSISTAAMLFLDDASKTPSKRTTAPPSIIIKWGEGSEAGVPDMTIQK